MLEMAEIGSGFPHELEVPVKGSLSVYWYSISLLLLESTDVCNAMYILHRMYICLPFHKMYN